MRENHAVVNIALTFGNGAQLALQQGLAQGSNAVDMDMAFQMVIFVLNDAGTDAFKHLLVLLEVLVEILDTDFLGTHHLFVNVRQAKATLLERHHLAKGLNDLGIDKHLLKILAFRIVRKEGVTIDDEQTDGFIDLRSGQSDAFGVCLRLPHVLQQRIQLRIVGGDGLSDGFQRGVTVCYYW